MKTSSLIMFFALIVSSWALALPFKSHRRNQVKDDDDTCDVETSAKTKKCLTEYYDFFGLNSTLPHYAEYRKRYDTILYGFGTQGPSIVCNYVMFSYSCLDLLLDTVPCIFPDEMVKMFGLGKADSMSYASDILMRIGECASADQLTKNFACLKDVHDNKQKELAACSARIDGVEPQCNDYDNYVTCVTKTYVAACGQGIRSLACQISEASVFFNVGDDDCLQECPEL